MAFMGDSMQSSERIQRILNAGRSHFSQYGFYGARIDTISSASQTNKRLVYEFCHTKEGLYMAVLSDVSREIMAHFEEIRDSLVHAPDIGSIYLAIIALFERHAAFVKLWAWERMSPTIHGPRILETALSIFENARAFARGVWSRQSQTPLSDAFFEALEALCHGYILSQLLYELAIREALTEDMAKQPVAVFCPQETLSLASSHWKSHMHDVIVHYIDNALNHDRSTCDDAHV